LLVDGSVRLLCNKVRIAAQLIRAATEENVWTSAPLTEDTKDVFAAQEKIAGLIAQTLSPKLGAGSAASKVPVNPAGFELHVQARQWRDRRSLARDRAGAAHSTHINSGAAAQSRALAGCGHSRICDNDRAEAPGGTGAYRTMDWDPVGGRTSRRNMRGGGGSSFD
jgi:hypothetical protein